MSKRINFAAVTTFASKKQKVDNESNNEIPHPISLVFNYVDDPYMFVDASMVCRAWRKELDMHIFWKNLVEHLDFESPNPRSRKYKTYKSIIAKNAKKLCYCKRNIGEKNNNLKIIEFKIGIIREYCNDRAEFYRTWLTPCYYEFVLKIRDWVRDIDEQLEYKKRCDLCDNEESIYEQIHTLIKDIYKENRCFDRVNKFFNRDVIKVVVRNLYNILNDRFIYIEKFGGVVKSENHPYIPYLVYDDD